MKLLLKKCLIALFLISVVISLTACISEDEAKAIASDFALCIAEGRYDDAVTLIHPHSIASKERLIWFIDDCEAEQGFDFSNGFEIIEYTGHSSHFYNTEIGGAVYELRMKASIGGVETDFRIQIIDNDSGYGIYYIEFDRV